MVTNDFLSGLRFIFSMGWKLITAFCIPGTNVTPAALMLFVSVSFISLKFLTQLFGIGGVSSTNVAHAQRTREGRSSKKSS